MARLGTESAFEVLARAQAIEAAGGKIIHLEIGEPDFPTAPHIVEAAVEALRAGATHYVPAPGIPPLRQAVAALAGTAFGPYGEGFLRFSYPNSVENIRAALEAIRAQLG
jgi:aspartate/methionine/tyrosine aminotransferase